MSDNPAQAILVAQSDAPLKPITIQATITPAEFKVDLAQFKKAMDTVSAEVALIKNDQASLLRLFQEIETDWQSPAGTAYAAFYPDFSNVLQLLVDLLDSIVRRMNTTYGNYVRVEEVNTQILADNQQIHDLVNQEKATVNADNARISAEIAQIKAEINANHGFGNAQINAQIADVNSQIKDEKAYIAEMTNKINSLIQEEKNLASSLGNG